MNYSFEITSEENYSEDILSENASSSTIKACPNLSKNMSKTPFKTSKKSTFVNLDISTASNINMSISNTPTTGNRYPRKAMKSQSCLGRVKMALSLQKQISASNVNNIS
mmetsp:Transcript_24766/g.21990  ORF Transcript_24766/g.21990 Transcript_24766/m.21990 type:complete len:109 (+) Transcript_24766:22-348(+)